MKRGFSLAETAVAMAILGLVLIFVLNLFPRAMLLRRTSEQRLQAQSLARSALEEQLAKPFNRLQSQDLEPVERDGVRYQLSLEVSHSPQASAEFLRRLRLVVRWSFQGRSQQLERVLYRHRLAHNRHA